MNDPITLCVNIDHYRNIGERRGERIILIHYREPLYVRRMGQPVLRYIFGRTGDIYRTEMYMS